MTVIHRLFALYQPVEATCPCDFCEGHEWTPLRGLPPRVLKMRPVRHRHPALALWDEVDAMPIGGVQRYLNRSYARVLRVVSRNLDTAILHGLTVQ